MKSNDIAFAKGLSSLFIVGTPLQVLCMADAIEEFEIVDYEIVVLYHPLEKRCNQVISMLDNLNMRYLCFDYSEFRTFKIIFYNIAKVLGIHKKYLRVFVGDYYYLIYYLIGLHFIQTGGVFVCIDDGNNTIGALIGQKRERNYLTKFYYLIRDVYFICNKICYEKYFYTLYSGVLTSKVVYPNKLLHLQKKFFSNSIIGNNIYFIGTNPADYIPEYEISESFYKETLYKVLVSIREKHNSKNLYYIPHGRDNSIEIKQFCQSIGFSFLELSCAIEYFFLHEVIYPYLVVGFQSSALYNIKKIFPKTLVYNLYLKNSQNKLFMEQKVTSELYSDIGIINCTISCPEF